MILCSELYRLIERAIPRDDALAAVSCQTPRGGDAQFARIRPRQPVMSARVEAPACPRPAATRSVTVWQVGLAIQRRTMFWATVVRAVRRVAPGR